MKEGYLKAIPLHDPAEPTSWNVYYGKREVGVACRVHGILTKEGFKADGASAGGGHERAFASERAAEENKFPPIDRIALGGPITAEALGVSGSVGEVTLAELGELAKSDSARTRKVVALALRRMRHAHGVPVLKRLLADPDEYVRKQAAWALGNIGTPADAAELAKLLEDPAERVRDFAAFALARLGDERGVAAALAALADGARNPLRRGEAAIALADGPVNLLGARDSYGASRWKDEKMEKDRPEKLAVRVRAALDAVLAGKAQGDLAKACARGLERIKSIGA